MKKNLRGLIIIGAGGFGREVLAWARESVQYGTSWRIKGFIDDNIDALDKKNTPARVIGRLAEYQPLTEDVFICAIGTPAIRKRATGIIKSRGGEFTQLVHRTALLGDDVTLGAGVILCPYSVVSANNVLEDGVAVNLHATVDHDARVGAWSQINCHCDLTASVVLEEEVFLGSRVSIIPNVRIGRQAYVGAGSVIIRDVPPGAVVAGVPSRRIG